MARKKSSLTDDMEHCYFCGKTGVQIHHCIHGYANRKKSEKYGYVLPLCVEHHTGWNGVHNNAEMDLFIKRIAQNHYESNCGTREDFIQEFGKSYLD